MEESFAQQEDVTEQNALCVVSFTQIEKIRSFVKSHKIFNIIIK